MKNVLIVDDEPFVREVLLRYLAGEGYNCTPAANGKEAWEALQDGDFSLLITDVMMPGMDGFETCRRIKANPATQHIPVIMVTALDQPSDRVQGLEAGAEDFLTKPVNDVALLARVKSLVRLKMVTDELRMRAATSERMG